MNTFNSNLRILALACMSIASTAIAEDSYCPRSPVGAVQSDGGVIVIAKVTLGTPDYVVELKQRPEKVIPPHFDLLCTPPQGPVIQVETSYTVSATFGGNHIGESTYVYDADARVKGPLEAPIRLSIPVPDPLEPTSKQMCGGIAGVTCPTDIQYCKLENCGVADESGVCTTRPEFCTEVYDPVCGCDGKTHSNSCHAAAAGINIRSAGECKAD